MNHYEIYPQWRHRYAPGVTRNTERVRAVVPEGTPVRLAPREHLRWQWLFWREAADACFALQRRGDPATAEVRPMMLGVSPCAARAERRAAPKPARIPRWDRLAYAPGEGPP